MSGPARRVILCGLDGATWGLLGPLMDAGVMPRLKAALSSGASGDCHSTLPPITAPAWTTCVTGMNPGKHGVFTFFTRDPQTFAPRFVSSAAIRVPTLWSRLSEKGRRVGVANVPITYPPETVNGYMLTGFLTPKGRPYTYPASLQSELDAAGYRITAPPPRDDDIPEGMARRWLAELYDVTQRRTETVLELNRRYDPEFAMVVYMTPDHVQHPFYKLLDPTQEHYGSKLGDALREPLHRCYAALDDAVAAYTAALDPDDLLLVCSDHGFGPHDGTLYLNRWLAESGYLKIKKTTMLAQESRRIARSRLARRWPGLKARAGGPEAFEDSYIDRDASLAIGGGNAEFAVYALRNDAPMAEIAEGLLALRDPHTGGRVVEEAIRREDAYTGPHLGDAPELLLRMTGDRYSIRSRLITRQRGVFARNSGPDGEHIRTGVVMAFGGPVVQKERVTARLEDLAPTILYALGEEISSEMDGRALTEIFRDEVTREYAPRIVEEEAKVSEEEASPYSEQDAAQIAERLANLGYID